MKRLLALIIAAIMLSSCGSSRMSLGSTRYLSVEVFQTLSDTEALAMSLNPFSSHYGEVVKIYSRTDFFYDGVKIRGTYVMVDRYTYESRSNGYKTVPVYMRQAEFKRLNR